VIGPSLDLGVRWGPWRGAKQGDGSPGICKRPFSRSLFRREGQQQGQSIKKNGGGVRARTGGRAAAGWLTQTQRNATYIRRAATIMPTVPHPEKGRSPARARGRRGERRTRKRGEAGSSGKQQQQQQAAVGKGAAKNPIACRSIVGPAGRQHARSRERDLSKAAGRAWFNI
jgi:hypothetical protein